MSTGEQALLSLYSSVYDFIIRDKSQFQKKKSYVLLLDEPEHGYHAVWKKKFIWTLNQTLPDLFSSLEQKPTLQIIFTTHDALTLSDLPNDKISYLKRLEDNSIKVFHQEDSNRPSKSFGANITDLLADSFFVDDGLIGDFAKEKIQETIKWLNDINRDASKKWYYESVIKIIDEPIVQRKLSEMYDEIFNEDLEVQTLDQQIKFLENLKSRKKES